MLRPLLVRTPLRPGESLLSLMLRLAALNRYTLRELSALCRDTLLAYPADGLDPLGQPKHAETLIRLAILTGLKPEVLYRATLYRFVLTLADDAPGTTLPVENAWRFLPRALSPHFHPRAQAQFCPVCLDQAAYHQLMWMSKAVAICPEHQCLLVDRCRRCHQPVTIEAVVRAQCLECEADLRRTPSPSMQADAFGMFAQQTIAAWLRDEPLPASGWRDTLPQRPAKTLYRLFMAVCETLHHHAELLQPYFHRASPGRRLRTNDAAPNGGSPAMTYLIGATAFQALVNWPLGLLDFLDAYASAVKPHVPSMKGCVALDLRLACRPDDEFDFVRQVLLDYQHVDPTQWPSAAAGDPSPWLGAWIKDRRLPRLTVIAAARRLGVSVSVVQRLMSTRTLSDAGKRRWVWHREVSELCRHLHQRISVDRAADWLGLAPEQMEQLIRFNLAPDIFRPERARHLTVRRMLQFLNHLAQRCVVFNVQEPWRHRWTVKPKQAEKMVGRYLWTGQLYLLGQVLTGALTAYFPCLRDALNFSKVEYDLGEVELGLQQFRAEHFLRGASEPKG